MDYFLSSIKIRQIQTKLDSIQVLKLYMKKSKEETFVRFLLRKMLFFKVKREHHLELQNENYKKMWILKLEKGTFHIFCLYPVNPIDSCWINMDVITFWWSKWSKMFFHWRLFWFQIWFCNQVNIVLMFLFLIFKIHK